MDIRELYTEANNNAEHQCHNKILEDAYMQHGTIGTVENEDNKDIDQRDCAACNQRYVEEKIEGNCRPNYLDMSVLVRACGKSLNKLTSAMSVAIIADSANIYRMMTNHLGRCLRQFSARLRPVTLPSLIHKVWRKIAKRLDIRTTKRCANLVAAPAMAQGQQSISIP